MTNNEFILQALPIVMANDVRLQICRLTRNNDGVFTHEWEKCPRCKAIWILETFG